MLISKTNILKGYYTHLGDNGTCKKGKKPVEKRNKKMTIILNLKTQLNSQLKKWGVARVIYKGEQLKGLSFQSSIFCTTQVALTMPEEYAGVRNA